jgi:hypothetical protein
MDTKFDIYVFIYRSLPEEHQQKLVLMILFSVRKKLGELDLESPQFFSTKKER